MRLVFIDESARDDAYYFFGALIVDAEAVRSIERALDEIAVLVARAIPTFDPSAEFHAVDMFHGKGAWRGVPLGWRVKAARLVAGALSRSSGVFVFRGVDLVAQRSRYGEDSYPAHLLTLGQLLEEVDRRLAGLDEADQLGLVLADEHHSAAGARRSLRDFKLAKVPGYTNHPLTRIADTMYFGPSHESRLLQAADFATYFLNRNATVVERDLRAEKAVAAVVRRVRQITVQEYVWSPPPPLVSVAAPNDTTPRG
ncbi:DUF3800 domain-containing protein [Curtobacterium sp. MCPF17_002]|uniref:DUF3800 domain-containing protein n=1 Tax=Curtobacterium sp. MCPF17_002 TaxID=2175645 RepID=UPI000DA971EE|nr:DUF3800 domain-containing protein [Curtobacterium sp. MCPF17_002]WIB76848.1 DUF3800 domain-containing protein [Curtobacterium sp. MCPF17_002]